jgi:hypothetical protein
MADVPGAGQPQAAEVRSRPIVETLAFYGGPAMACIHTLP